MENRLPTQQTFNEFVEKIKENLNYIYIVLMIVINVLLSTLKIENGYIGLNYPNSALGWAMWALQIAIQTIVGVLILNAFRRQGINLGHKAIKETYNKYLEITRKDVENRPRSLKEYLRKETLKDSISKSLILVVLSVFVGSVVIGYNLNNLLSLFTNIIFSVCFGIKSMMDAENYVVTELIVWYQQKIDKEEVPNQTNVEPSEEINDGL